MDHGSLFGGPFMSSGYINKTLSNPSSARQYAMATRPGFGGFDSFGFISGRHPEAHCYCNVNIGLIFIII